MKKNKLPTWGYKFLKPILSPIFKFWYRPTIENKEYIPKEGPIIIAGNHKNIMDQCLVIIATKRIIHYMAKNEYFKGPFAWFFKITGCISVNRQIHDKEATAKAIEVLNDKGAIGIFPEGTRNKTKEILLPLKMGAVSMAQKTKALIVPFAITGDYHFRSSNLKIKFGKPFKVIDDLEKANEKLKTEITNLLKEN